MEIRNIQKTGGASFNLTLPKEWIKRLNLKDKDKLNIYVQKSGYLIIQPYSFHRLKPIATIHIDHLTKERIHRELIGYYISGVEEIIILGKKISYLQRNWVRQISYRLIGFDYVEGTSEKIVLKNILDTKEFSIVNNVHRMVHIIDSMYQDLILACKNNDTGLARDIIERDTEVDRLHTSILRQFNYFLRHVGSEELIGLSLPDVHYYERIAIRLERMADHIVRVAEITLLSKPALSASLTRNVRKKMKDVGECLKHCGKLIYNLEKETAHFILDLCTDSKQGLTSYSLSKKHSLTENMIQNSLVRIENYIINIAEETVNYSITKNDVYVI